MNLAQVMASQAAPLMEGRSAGKKETDGSQSIFAALIESSQTVSLPLNLEELPEEEIEELLASLLEALEELLPQTAHLENGELPEDASDLEIEEKLHPELQELINELPQEMKEEILDFIASGISTVEVFQKDVEKGEMNLVPLTASVISLITSTEDQDFSELEENEAVKLQLEELMTAVNELVNFMKTQTSESGTDTEALIQTLQVVERALHPSEKGTEPLNGREQRGAQQLTGGPPNRTNLPAEPVMQKAWSPAGNNSALKEGISRMFGSDAPVIREMQPALPLQQQLILTQTGQPPQQNVSSEQLLKQFEHLLSRAKIHTLENGVQKMTLKLHPASLGRIDITLVQQSNGVLTAKIMTATAQTREMLDSQLPNLKQSLTQQNIQVDRVEITQQQATLLKDAKEESGQQEKQQYKQPEEEQDEDTVFDELLDAVVQNTEESVEGE
ncbi:flagellar hook-length control protein FliK [Alkalicoccus urumqiensis]|uniref:Flagellar hook-length control protein-like C-terminal domain-containing protein n=1 Tax=Alkalicoccus urumqiensis TaxID=1548213 RepID=A0A2P6MG35_ALKUR|nr:flagellar hook-length control protein FliK [Alkalicoccus urumqiensis]PRO65227.1 hypothetical protein C6I21_10505 [Alkalicoccus urumqiensis]